MGELKRTNFLDYFRANSGPVIAGALVGSASHLFWDGFTHNDGYFVKVLPAYGALIITISGYSYPIWHVMQHASTIIGLGCVGIYIARCSANNPQLKQVDFRYWFYVFAITSLVASLRFSIYSNDLSIGNFVVTVISGFCIGLFVCGLMSFNRAKQS